MSSACRRYQSDMAELSDQVRLLYREHSNSTASWQQKCNSADKQVSCCSGVQLGLCSSMLLLAACANHNVAQWQGRRLT